MGVPLFPVEAHKKTSPPDWSRAGRQTIQFCYGKDTKISNTMANFDIAYAQTSRWEGGYADHPADRGKETYAGVSRNFWPNWSGWPIIDAVKARYGLKGIDARLKADSSLQSSVHAFYETNFWQVNRLDAIINQEVANRVYDIGVNSGTTPAAKTLQEALNLTNANGQAYPDILIDGVIGPKTVQLANAHTRPQLLVKVINALQAERYIKIMRLNPGQEVFANSWFSRV